MIVSMTKQRLDRRRRHFLVDHDFLNTGNTATRPFSHQARYSIKTLSEQYRSLL